MSTSSSTPSTALAPTIEQFADWLVHHGLAELARGAIEIPPAVVTRSGANDAVGVRIVVTVVRVEKEPYRDMFQGEVPSIDFGSVESTSRLEKTSRSLRDIESAALKASGKTPVTIKALARRAGYSYGSYFRDAVRRLVDLGLLVRVTGGVQRADGAGEE